MIVTVEVSEAGQRLPELVRSLTGRYDEILLSEGGITRARFVAVAERAGGRQPGTARGLITLSPDSDAPLPSDVFSDVE